MTLIKYIDTFIPIYLFLLSTLSILRAEILSHASFSLQYQALRRCFNEYLLNKGMTIHHLENSTEQPMDGQTLNQRMLGLNGG